MAKVSERARSLFIEIDGLKKSIVIGTVYKHPMLAIDEFNQYIASSLDVITHENKESVLCGDFNINLLEYGEREPISNFVDMVQNSMLQPLILSPTRISKTSKTIIDNIFSSFTRKTHSGNLVLSISDHLPQFAIIETLEKIPQTNLHPRKQRNFRNFSDECFPNDLKNVNWKDLLMHCTDVNSSFPTFLNKFNEILDRHAPFKT